MNTSLFDNIDENNDIESLRLLLTILNETFKTTFTISSKEYMKLVTIIRTRINILEWESSPSFNSTTATFTYTKKR